MDDARPFYDALAARYHLLFEDWPAAVQRQGAWLDRCLRAIVGDRPLDVLDAACGIGTQALGLAPHGHRVRATDASPAAVDRVRHEAAARGITLDAGVADLRTLDVDVAGTFDAVLVLDNALPHLCTTEDLARAARALRAKVRPSGVLLASLRDDDELDSEQARAATPRVLGVGATQRIAFQLWDWDDDHLRYALRQFLLTVDATGAWQTSVYATRYRAWRRAEFAAAFEAAGFRDLAWRLPGEAETFYQPLLIARP